MSTKNLSMKSPRDRREREHRGSRGLYALTAGYRFRYLSAFGAMWFGIAVLFLVPLASQAAIDGMRVAGGPVGEQTWVDAIGPALILGQSGARGLLYAAIGMVLLTALAGVFRYLQGRFAAQASEGIVERLRARLYDHLNRLPCSFHDRSETGDLVQRCTSDVETLRAFLSAQSIEIGRAVLLLVTVLPLLLGLHVGLTLWALLLFPVIIGFAYFFFEKTKSLFQQADEAEGALTSVLQENLSGIRVVRAFAQQDHETQKFAAKNEAYRKKLCQHIDLLGFYWGCSDLLTMLQSGIVLLAGAYYVEAGELSIGTLFAFLTFETLLLWPIRLFGRVLSETGKAMVSLDRLLHILGEEEESAEDPPPLLRPTLSGKIEVRGLRHSFRDGDHALDGLDLSIARGETVALVGAPGSGKSTIVQLLLRLYPYEEGSIRLDGKELRELDRDAVREQISVVLQEPFLYSRSISYNLRVARKAASDTELVESARAASVHDAIDSFDASYETLLGERGVNLSGGQRQRIALARALLKDSPILILDDAMSAVDTKTEARILEALSKRKGQRSTILIAHRLSSLRLCDRVLVLENGRVVQDGSPEALGKRNGPFRRLLEIQGDLMQELKRELSASGGSDSE